MPYNTYYLAPYDPDWKREFAELGARIKHALGDIPLRVDHIGSTSVEGLAAKPIIDIQVSVASLEPIGLYKPQMEAIGFIHQADNEERTKRYFRESPGQKRVHIHVREQGSFGEQFALLFRDYLREHPSEGQLYVAEKRRLMSEYPDERQKYVEEKEPMIWEIMRRASRWSQQVGWKPGPADY
ncbi:GrpB family protein [Paenibacillus sp. VCA1]|uniref:GrpB family protein n=1 Tax=Paenibacillus sp. VCA1 TaxID=3039148 RepID=UPI0028723167|nr:GrpB family protein [Paenibacillus sp. VCA1]MDR9856503.1 GrpB family protein [Paenibacillus sp. VCA1]